MPLMGEKLPFELTWREQLGLASPSVPEVEKLLTAYLKTLDDGEPVQIEMRRRDVLASMSKEMLLEKFVEQHRAYLFLKNGHR